MQPEQKFRPTLHNVYTVTDNRKVLMLLKSLLTEMKQYTQEADFNDINEKETYKRYVLATKYYFETIEKNILDKKRNSK